jgi:hypothetical protein
VSQKGMGVDVGVAVGVGMGVDVGVAVGVGVGVDVGVGVEVGMDVGVEEGAGVTVGGAQLATKVTSTASHKSLLTCSLVT